MILDYYRPQTIEDALHLLENPEILVVPLGGGTSLSHAEKSAFGVVDLQDLPLNGMVRQGNLLKIGATTRLQTFLNHPALPDGLAEAIRQEDTLNIRNMATLGGKLVTADGKSTLATALLALDARLKFMPGDEAAGLGDWLPTRAARSRRKLIVEIEIPTQSVVKFEQVARSPEDRPIVCVAVAVWPSGRTRVALGGIGSAPILAFDGPESSGAELAAENAFSQATDAFASGAYRSQIAKILVQRLISFGENTR
jgi:putative selenate reductase FAD-binding subunit